MTIAIPTATNKVLLAASAAKHAVWFQNFSTVGIYLFPADNAQSANPSAPTQEFYLQPTTDVTIPSTLVIQNSGGDTTIANREWRARHSDAGSVNINCGKW